MGFVQWFNHGNKLMVERAITDLKEVGCARLRTGFSWAEWYSGGKDWYIWLYNRLHKKGLEILPDFLYTPVPIARSDPKTGRQRTSHPPEDLTSPQGILSNIDIVGIHGFPHTPWGAKHSHQSMGDYARDLRKKLNSCGCDNKIWLSETGYATLGDSGGTQERQVEIFGDLHEQAYIDRAYWWSLYDLEPHIQSYTQSQIGWYEELFYHFGVKTYDGKPKLLYEALKIGEMSLNGTFSNGKAPK